MMLESKSERGGGDAYMLWGVHVSLVSVVRLLLFEKENV